MDAFIAPFDQLLGLRVAFPDQLLPVRVRQCLLSLSILFEGLVESPGTNSNECVFEDSFESDATERYARRIEAEEVRMYGFSQQRSRIFRYIDGAPLET